VGTRRRHHRRPRRLRVGLPLAVLALVSAVVLAVERPWSGGRDPRRWPFASTSIWNTPIGAHAAYAPFHATTDAAGGVAPQPGMRGPGLAVTTTGGRESVGPGYGVNAGVDVNYLFYAVDDDPTVTVHQQQQWTGQRCTGGALAKPSASGPTPWRVHLPADAVVPDAAGGQTPNASSALVQPDGRIVSLNVTARCTPGADDLHGTPSWQFTPARASQLDADARLTGAGSYGGHGGGGLSALGGTLTAADLVSPAPIHHALSLDINGAEYLSDAGGTGHVWPALHNDDCAGCASYVGGYHGTTPALRMGALLALPPSVSAAAAGVRTPLGLKLFHALQDYGAYVVDDTGWSSVDLNIDQQAQAAAQRTYGHPVDAGRPGSTWGAPDPAYYDDLMAIYGQLQVITNNTAGSIGGGGTPRAPLAPALA